MTEEKYFVGEEITVYMNHVERTRPEGRARLLERLETYPTKNQWTVGRWKLHFLDEKGRDIQDAIAIRPVLEVGNPNTNLIQTEDYSRYLISSAIMENENLNEEVVNAPKRRGRPPGKGNVKANQEKTVEDGEVTPKRRGRPALSEEEKARRAAEKAAKPSRGRGRPPLSDEEKARRAAEKAAKSNKTEEENEVVENQEQNSEEN